MLQYFKNLFYTTYFTTELETSKHLLNTRNKIDKKIIIVCITVSFSVIMVRYFGDTKFLLLFLKGLGAEGIFLKLNYLFFHSNDNSLYRLVWWIFTIMVFYFIVPILIIKCLWRENLTDYGMKLKGAFKEYRLYIYMMLIMIPLVLYFSTTQSFLERYPFYRPKHNEPLFPKFIEWEILYFIQFFAVEFFFRGFMVHGTKKRFGYYSVFIMIIPYCMVHFGKPFPEILSAIAAGIILGTLSLKSRSIMLGVALHYSVAFTMDMLSLWHL
jgi:membrane protease YdiL (CAAX protease family)